MTPVELGVRVAVPSQDDGVSAGNGKGQLFVRGKVIKTVPEHRIVHTLLDEAPQRDWSDPSD